MSVALLDRQSFELSSATGSLAVLTAHNKESVCQWVAMLLLCTRNVRFIQNGITKANSRKVRKQRGIVGQQLDAVDDAASNAPFDWGGWLPQSVPLAPRRDGRRCAVGSAHLSSVLQTLTDSLLHEAPTGEPLAASLHLAAPDEATLLAPDAAQSPDQPRGSSPAGDASERYELQTKRGEGAFGEVYKAVDTRLNRLVAVKLLKNEQDPATTKQWLAEARLVAKLSHPNIVAIYDILETPRLGLVMAFLDGSSLGDTLKRTPSRRLSASEAQRIAVSCLDALIYTHDHKVVHRDIKPDNIFLCRNGEVRLVDFGLAKLVEQSIQTATLAGSPAYMSPEAWDQKVGPSCDLWSVAVVMFQCLTGSLPFPSLQGVVGRTAVAPRVTLQAEDTPTHGHLVDVVACALTMSREDRHPTATAMLAAVKGV